MVDILMLGTIPTLHYDYGIRTLQLISFFFYKVLLIQALNDDQDNNCSCVWHVTPREIR